MPLTMWGPVVLDEDEFAEFERCTQEPQRPTPSIIKGAELLRQLYDKKDLACWRNR